MNLIARSGNGSSDPNSQLMLYSEPQKWINLTPGGGEYLFSPILLTAPLEQARPIVAPTTQFIDSGRLGSKEARAWTDQLHS